MKGQDIARVYARSLIELGNEQKVDVAEELTNIQTLINENNDLENLLFLDIFTSTEKINVLDKIFEKVKFSLFVQRFLVFLVEEKRIGLLPQIYKEIMVIDDHKKGFIRANIEGREREISNNDKERIYQYLKEKIGREPKLDYQQNEKITAGYRILAEDLHLDATIDHQFDILKQSILGD